MGEALAPDDPLHRVSGPHTAWTRVNIAEGIPGVSTPLNWSWWDDANKQMIRGAYFDMGVISRIEIPPAAQPDQRTSSIFYGRPALNLDRSREWADLQPGTSGDALEEHYFGAVRPGVQSHKSRRRYPVILLKSAPLWLGVPRLLARLHAEMQTFWRETVEPGPLDAPDRARAAFSEAQHRLATIARPHSTLALLTGAIMQQVSKLAARGGTGEAVTTALGGYESVEFETTRDLLAVAQDHLSLDAFLLRHGYQGPLQGELSAHTWREDPSPITELLISVRSMGEAAAERTVDRSAQRGAAEDEIATALRGPSRAAARALFWLARQMMPARELGKAGMVMASDAARAAARALGRDLHRGGRLADPEDVFYLTRSELLDAWPADAQDRVAERRERRAYYQSLELPESWIGMAEPLPVDDTASDQLEGLGVSRGVAEGPVRVLLDPASERLEPGEILVCEATDPSYASYFLVAAGVVTDLGGALSHGAIVAREVGIPCVVNTRVGSRKLRTGDRVRIDGSAGTVTRLPAR
jgi:pyruvate,water dikinase